jgi:hypothetical protein
MQGDTTVPMLGKITLAMALGQGMITECSRLVKWHVFVIVFS